MDLFIEKNMIKKFLFLLLLSALASADVIADNVTMGLTQSVNSRYNTLGSATYSNTTHVVNSGNQMGDALQAFLSLSPAHMVYQNYQSYASTSCWYLASAHTEYDFINLWMGYTLTIDDGYCLNISSMRAQIAIDNGTYYWKMRILNAVDEVLFDSDEQTCTKSSTSELTVSSSSLSVDNQQKLSALTGTVKVRIYFYNTSKTTYFAVPYLTVTGSVVQDTHKMVSFAAPAEVSGVVPPSVQIETGQSLTLPDAPCLHRHGYTLTGWNDGTNAYNVGQEVTIDANKTFTAVYTENNVTFAEREGQMNVAWPFATSNGAPAIKLDNASGYYTQKAAINGCPIDVAMRLINADLDNTKNADKASVGSTMTTLRIPAAKGMVLDLTIDVNEKNGYTNISFNDKPGATVGNSLKYVYTGAADSIDLKLKNIDVYALSVTYPDTYAPASSFFAIPTAAVNVNSNQAEMLIDGIAWVFGGSAQLVNNSTASKQMQTPEYFALENEELYLDVRVDNPLAAGDVICAEMAHEGMGLRLATEVGFSSALPGGISATTTFRYVIKPGDALVGKSDLFVYGATENTQINRLDVLTPATLSLSESVAFDYTQRAYNEVNVEINRSLAADNGWYSLCLPFAVEEPTMFSQVATYSHTENDGTCVFNLHDGPMAAGVPYLVKVGVTQLPLRFLDCTVAKDVAPQSNGVWCGVFNPTELQAGSFLLGTGSTLNRLTKASTMKGFRAYLVPSANARRWVLETPSGLTPIAIADDEEAQAVAYDLQGRRRDNRSAAGLMIERGEVKFVKP